MELVLIIIEIIVLAYLDKRIFGTFFTPLTVLATPFLGLVFLSILWGGTASMVSFYLPSLWVWIVGLFFFWLAGLLLAIAFIRKTNIVKKPFKMVGNISDFMRFFQVISLILILIIYIKLYRSLLDFTIHSEDFSDSLGGGIAAHANVWLRISIIYFFITTKLNKNHIINFVIISLWILFSFLYNAKTWILVTIIAGLIGRIIYTDSKISLKLILFLLGVGIIVFYISYSISFGRLASWQFIFNHFVYYTNAGILGFSEYIKNKGETGLSFEFLYQPIFNAYYKISGLPLKNIISESVVKIDSFHSGSNVKSFFGTIYIYGGTLGGIFTSFIWGGFCYLVLISTIRMRNIISFIIYLYIVSALFLGWFDIYFNTIGYYEIMLLGIAWIVCSAILINKGKLKIFY